MISKTTPRFRRAFANLPQDVHARARSAYRLFRENPHHPSLQFKQVHTKRPIFSARVGIGYRALTVRQDDAMIWFWIGSHADYDALLRSI